MEALGDFGLILLGRCFRVFDGFWQDAGGEVVPQFKLPQMFQNDLHCASADCVP